MRKLSLLILALMISGGCSDSGPNNPGTDRPRLAGGGRFDSDDPFIGGRDESGPQINDTGLSWPGTEPFQPYLDIVFNSDHDCTETPGRLVIRDSLTWYEWWESHNACLWADCWHDSSDGSIPGDPNNPSDSGRSGPCYADTPWVNFERESIVAISLSPDSGSSCLRSMWISDITVDETGTTVTYVVSSLDSLCCEMLMMPMVLVQASNVIAARVPHVVNEPVTWVAHDSTYSCFWEPDPNEPLVLYYTDATCELGGDEQVISDSARWAEWFHQAWACDSARWNYWTDSTGVTWPDDSTVVILPGDDSLKPEPYPNPAFPYWIPHVDFSTHAILILRSGEQAQWGGGIWLNDINQSGAGTTINYTVMQPADDCPPVEYLGTSVNPTVAIRVPLPIDPPIQWNRFVETITCSWVSDSGWVDPDGTVRDSTGP